MSIFTRIYLLLIVALFVAVISALVIVDGLYLEKDSEKFRSDTKVEAYLAKQWLADFPTEEWPQRIMDYPVMLVGYEVTLQPLPEPALTDDELYQTGQWDLWSASFAIKGYPGTIVVSPLEEPFSTLDLIEVSLPFIFLFTTLGLVFFLMSRYIAKSLNNLSEVTAAIGNGDLDIRADTGVPAPIKGMAQSINRMADQLHQTLTDQQITIGAIPHEIRSPIGRLRFALDMTAQARSLEQAQRQIEKADYYLDDMHRIVESILFLINQKGEPELSDQFSCADFAEELAYYYDQQTDQQTDTQAEDQKYDLRVTNEQDKNKQLLINYSNQHTGRKLTGNHSLLRQVATNLVDNALCYAHQTIQVEIGVHQDTAYLRVEDDGDGIAAEHQEKIFSPFYRVDASRTRATGGTGLGLALVQLIVKRHQGEIKVFDSSLGGAGFEVQWPVIRKSVSR